MSLKRDNSVWQENPKPFVFAKLEIGRKKTKYYSEYRKREEKINSDFYFLFTLCICIVLILFKYVNIYLVLT